MPGAPGVANELVPRVFEAKEEPPKPPLDAPPNVLPPPKLDFAPPRDPNPLAGGAAVVEDVAAGEAKELSLGAPPNGDPVFAAEPKLPKGDALELARLPNPEALNLSSDVWGRDSVLSEGFGAAGLAAMAAKGDAADVFANPVPAGIGFVDLTSSLSRARLASRCSPPFVAAWPLVGASFVLSSAGSEMDSSRGRLFFGLVLACAPVSVAFVVLLFGEAMSASISSILDTGAVVGLDMTPPSRSFVMSLDRLRACPSGFSEPFSSRSCFLSGCLSPSLSSSMSSRLRFLRNHPRSLSDPEALRLPGFNVPFAASLACSSTDIGFAVASMLVFCNFSRTGLPSLSLLLSLRAGDTAASAALGTGSCCSDELIAAVLCVRVRGVMGVVVRAGASVEGACGADKRVPGVVAGGWSPLAAKGRWVQPQWYCL